MRADNETDTQEADPEETAVAFEAVARETPPLETPAQRSGFGLVLGHPLLHVVLLIALVIVCYGRTLTSYFLADDFSQVAYVWRIFNGESNLLWSNWTGNYMQIPGMNVYRPWLLMTLVFDWLLYRTNSTGYYASNLIYFTGSVLFLYFICRQMTQGWQTGLSKLSSFLTACFFAASPLRCENITWVVGRVDVACIFFYFASLLSFLVGRARSNKLLAGLGILSFWLAILTKEMAVGLPVVLSAFHFLVLNKGSINQGFWQGFTRRVISAAEFALPLWISLIAYFAVRLVCLHTLVGGYVAGFGASQAAMMTQRWLDPDTLRRLFLPFSAALFPEPTSYSYILAGSYALLVALLALRALRGQFDLRWFTFLSVWLLTAAAPIYQLWGLGYNLEGARFYLFLSAPMSMFLPILLLKPAADRQPDVVIEYRLDLKLTIISCAAFLSALFVLVRLTYLSDLVWVHAGKEVKECFLQSKALAQTAGSQKYCLLGLPQERDGAHQILNGSTFDTMMSPPFVPDQLSRRFIVFNPIMFGPAQVINGTRARGALSQPSVTGPMVWSQATQQFVLNQLPAHQEHPVADFPQSLRPTSWQPYALGRANCAIRDGIVKLTGTVSGDGIEISKLNVNPLDFDFLEFQAKGWPAGVSPQFKVFFHGKKSVDYHQDDFVAQTNWNGGDKFSTVRVHLSHFWRWYAGGIIDELALVVPPAKSIELKDFKLLPADLIAPELILRGSPVDNRGVQTPPASWISAAFNRRAVPNVAGASIEISKANFFFDNFESFSDLSPVQTTLDLTGGAPLDPRYFSQPGFYQLRASCFDRDRRPIGEYSDPVTVRLR